MGPVTIADIKIYIDYEKFISHTTKNYESPSASLK